VNGDGMICSNNVKCPTGISSYSSNFTFGQNEADPWNPFSQNEQDIWVPQQQYITLPTCSKFLLISDGTKDGTSIEGRGLANEKTCPKVRNPPVSVSSSSSTSISTSTSTVTSTAKGGLKKKPSSNVRPPALATSEPLMEQSNIGPRRHMSKNILIMTFLFGLLALITGAHASPAHSSENRVYGSAEMRIRAVSNRVKVFAQNLNDDLAEKAAAQGLNADLFVHNLVADVISSVCDGYFKGMETKDFTPTVVDNCVKSIYGGDRLAQPALQFLAVFGASLLCNYVVSEAYPVAQEFYLDGCEGLQELAKRISPAASTASTHVSTSITPPTSLPSTVTLSGAPHLNFEVTVATFSSPMTGAAISQASLRSPVMISSISPKSSLLSSLSFQSSALEQTASPLDAISEIRATTQSKSPNSETYTTPYSPVSRTVSIPSPLVPESPLPSASIDLKDTSAKASTSMLNRGEESSKATSTRSSERQTSSQGRSVNISPTPGSSRSRFASSLSSKDVTQLSNSNPINAVSLSIPRTKDSSAEATLQVTSSDYPSVTNKPSPTYSLQASLSGSTSMLDMDNQSDIAESHTSVHDLNELPSSPPAVLDLPTSKLNNTIKSVITTVISPGASTTSSAIDSPVTVSGSTPLASAPSQTLQAEDLTMIISNASSNYNTTSTTIPIPALDCRSVELDFCPGVGCVDFLAHNEHCGSCQNNCPDGLRCRYGVCLCPGFDYMEESTIWTCNATEQPGEVDTSSTTWSTSAFSLLDPDSSTTSSIHTPLAQLEVNLSLGLLPSTVSRPAFVLLPSLSTTTSWSPPAPSTTVTQPPQLSASAPSTCPLPWFDTCSGTCVNYATDSFNCGGCGAQCSQNWSCEDGECRTVLTVYVEVEQTATNDKILPTTKLAQSTNSLPSKQTLSSSIAASTSAAEGAGMFIAMGLEGLW
jgi:hypothetical protein